MGKSLSEKNILSFIVVALKDWCGCIVSSILEQDCSCWSLIIFIISQFGTVVLNGCLHVGHVINDFKQVAQKLENKYF